MLVTLGWMLLAGLLVPVHQSKQIAQPAAAQAAPGRVTVWTDRQEPYRRGEAARVYLAAGEPAHVTVLRVDTDGRIRVLFPRDPWDDTFVRDDRTLEVSGRRGGRGFTVDDAPGIGYLFAVASPNPFEFDDITRGEYWDYRVIDGGRLRGDPYLLLTRLAERITPGSDYHYDISPYYVDRHYDYPRFLCYDCHAYASYDEWDPYERACSRFRMVIYDDPATYPYRYGRGRTVVAAPRPAGPRYVFLDADPRRDYVTRLSGPDAEPRRGSLERSRTGADVGGRGTVPAPGVRSLGPQDMGQRGPELAPSRPQQEGRRRPAEPRRRAPDPDATPEGLRPAEEGRVAPPERPARPPRSTGEPELRRRRP
ncbi:MAG TPA: DUF4384 domain-containing protein [Gemmatimonadales bacterium]|nr:DUF4384 domain-containing protein [Gemmatimonadales bacterium]